jgi:hypothetical protein
VLKKLSGDKHASLFVSSSIIDEEKVLCRWHLMNTVAPSSVNCCNVKMQFYISLQYQNMKLYSNFFVMHHKKDDVTFHQPSNWSTKLVGAMTLSLTTLSKMILRIITLWLSVILQPIAIKSKMMIFLESTCP